MCVTPHLPTHSFQEEVVGGEIELNSEDKQSNVTKRWVTQTYDIVTFFTKFYAAEIDGLEGANEGTCVYALHARVHVCVCVCVCAVRREACVSPVAPSNAQLRGAPECWRQGGGASRQHPLSAARTQNPTRSCCWAPLLHEKEALGEQPSYSLPPPCPLLILLHPSSRQPLCTHNHTSNLHHPQPLMAIKP